MLSIAMSDDYTPWVTWINGKCINAKSIFTYKKEGLSIGFKYYSGDSELLRFGSEQEIQRALLKIKEAIQEAVYADEEATC